MAESAFPNEASRAARVERPHRPALARAAAHRSDSGAASTPAGPTLRSTNPAGSRRTAPVSAPKRVRVPELALGIVLVVGSALAAVLWHQSTSTSAQALVLAVPVERGHTFTAADFKPATVRTEGVLLVDFARAEEFVGRIATANLSVGAPITTDVAAEVLPLADGQALVGRRLEAGMFPGGLTVGATVEIVLILDPDSLAALAGDTNRGEPDSAATVNEKAGSAGDPALAGSAWGTTDPGGEPGTDGLSESESAAGAAPTSATLATSDEEGRIIATVEALEESPDGLLATIATLRLDQSSAPLVAQADGVRLVQVPAS